MPTKGLVQCGYYQDKMLAGGGTANVVVVAPSCIYSSSAINGTFYPLSITSGNFQDLIVKNLTVNSTLVPVCNIGEGKLGCFKIICSGDLTLNSGGSITVDGTVADSGNAVHTSAGPSVGYFPGSLGGSGGCVSGSTVGSPVYPGSPPSIESIFYAGGNGGAGLGTSPHAGGQANFELLGVLSNNIFQPSIYQNATILTNITPTLVPSLSAGAASVGLIWGGASGGGPSAEIGSPAAGGVGGGVIYVSCDRLIMNGGTISANGQPSSTGGSGGGGIVIIVCSEVVWKDDSSYIQALSPGSGVQKGGDGKVLLFSNTIVASFGGLMGKTQYLAAMQTYQGP